MHAWNFALLALLWVAACPLAAQQGCPVPPLPPASKEPNIFNPQQEMELGDAVAEHLRRNFRLTDDPQLTSYLQNIGDRLLKHLPPTGLKFRYFLVDLSDANAFAIPGGRVYVSTKIIALAHNEDELAGILAHEFGHIVTHQAAIDVSRNLKALLGVTQVSDRRDVFDKYNRMIENWRRRPGDLQRERQHSQERQEAADRVALYAVVASGYSPQALADMFDRIAGTEGKTGSWLSDLFGTTRPEGRRLREMLKTTQELPPACVERAPAIPAEFKKWQEQVVSYSGWEHQEVLHDVVAKVRLDPELRSDITYLRFSPDGRYILAQDPATIYVLSRRPLAPLFQMDAPDAYLALFTPDSKSVIFYTRHLRVETWSVADQSRTSVFEVAVRGGCLQSDLSPDGKTLACLEHDWNLTLMDTASNAEIFHAKSFFRPTGFAVLALWGALFGMLRGEAEIEFVHLGFSPDAHYFLASSAQSAVAVDVSNREEISLPGSIKNHISDGFAFLAPNRLVGRTRSDWKHSPILEFPSGKKLGEVSLGMGKMSAVAHGNCLMLRPVVDFPVGVFDLSTGKGLFAQKRPALDLYDDISVSEQLTGDVALSDVRTHTPLSHVTLPGGRLGGLHARVLSPDLKWFAASVGDRGAVWDLRSGKRRAYLRGFDGAYFDPAGWVYADFAKFEKTDREIRRINLESKAVDPIEKIEQRFARQHGKFLVTAENSKGVVGSYGTLPGGFVLSAGRNVTEEVQDVRTGTTLWMRHFPKEAPLLFVEPDARTAVFEWKAGADTVEDEGKQNPQIASQLAAAKPEKNDYFLEVADAQSGKTLGSLLVKTNKGSFRVQDAFAFGDWVLVTDSLDRLLVYSLSSGEEKGRVFGYWRAVSPRAGLVAVQNETGHLIIYDLATLEERDEFVFAGPIVAAKFSEDGQRLLVVTSDQTVYTLDVSSDQPSLASTPPQN